MDIAFTTSPAIDLHWASLRPRDQAGNPVPLEAVDANAVACRLFCEWVMRNGNLSEPVQKAQANGAGNEAAMAPAKATRPQRPPRTL